MDGWIKIYRKLLEWEWYTDSNVVHLFIHLLLSANFTETRRKGVIYNAGQVVTSIVMLAAELDKSYPTILRCLKILSESGAINVKSTNKKTIITICKYKQYQQDSTSCYKNNLDQTLEQPLEQVLDQTLEQPLEPIYNKNIKKEKNINNSLGQKRNVFIPPTIEEVKEYCKERNNNVDAERFIDFYTMKGWFVGKNKMKDWKAAVRTWEGKPTTNALQTKKEKENLDVNRFWNTKN